MVTDGVVGEAFNGVAGGVLGGKLLDGEVVKLLDGDEKIVESPIPPGSDACFMSGKPNVVVLLLLLLLIVVLWKEGVLLLLLLLKETLVVLLLLNDAEPKVLLLKGNAAAPKVALSKGLGETLLDCPPPNAVLLGPAGRAPPNVVLLGSAMAGLLVGGDDAVLTKAILLGMVPQSSATGGREEEVSIPESKPPKPRVEGRGGREAALSTLMVRPSSSFPDICDMAVSASASDSKVTKPKPLNRPVSRSLMSFTSTTSPCAAKAFLTVSSSVRKDRPPTKSFVLKLRASDSSTPRCCCCCRRRRRAAIFF